MQRDLSANELDWIVGQSTHSPPWVAVAYCAAGMFSNYQREAKEIDRGHCQSKSNQSHKSRKKMVVDGGVSGKFDDFDVPTPWFHEQGKVERVCLVAPRAA